MFQVQGATAGTRTKLQNQMLCSKICSQEEADIKAISYNDTAKGATEY